MSYRADLHRDLPSTRNPTRVIFYQQGLKVYGLLPYLINRKVKGEFYSNYYVHDSGWFAGSGIVAHTNEPNYTVVPYSQSPETAKLLWDWLHSDAGFEWAIASKQEFYRNICQANIANVEPETWCPIGNPDGFARVMSKTLTPTEIATFLEASDVG